MDNIFVHLFFFFIHNLICFIATIILLFVSDLRWCVFLLLAMMVAKWSHYYFGMCLITPLELNEHFITASEMGRTMIDTDDFPLSCSESVIINAAFLLVCFKIFFIMFFRYYKIGEIPFIKKTDIFKNV